MRDALDEYEMPTELTGSLSFLGMFLAAVGLYGVSAYAVNRRQHEIGIRLALGAQRGDVLKMILRHGLRLAIAGVGTGFGAAVALTRAVPALVRGVSPNDPTAFAGSAVLVLLVTVLASYLPARRATKVDPMLTLRCQ
jgi:putative ABC transport system permease protein